MKDKHEVRLLRPGELHEIFLPLTQGEDFVFDLEFDEPLLAGGELRLWLELLECGTPGQREEHQHRKDG